MTLAQHAAELLEQEAGKLHDKGQYAECWEACKKVLQFSANSYRAHYYGAQALFHLNKVTEAQTFLDRAPDEIGSHPTILWIAACNAVALGELDVATERAVRALSLDPGLREKLLADSDLRPIWNKIRAHTLRPQPAQPPEKPTNPNRRNLAERLRNLKVKPPLPPDTGACCYMPAGSPRTPTEIVYLCPRCTRRSAYRAKALPHAKGFFASIFSPDDAPSANPTPELGSIIELATFAVNNRRTLARLPNNFSIDETDLCQNCGKPFDVPHIRVSFACTDCNRATVHHVGLHKINPIHYQLRDEEHLAMSLVDCSKYLMQTARLAEAIKEDDLHLQLNTTRFCAHCFSSGARFPTVSCKLLGELHQLRIEPYQMVLLRRFIASLDLPPEQAPAWEQQEAEQLNTMFAERLRSGK